MTSKILQSGFVLFFALAENGKVDTLFHEFWDDIKEDIEPFLIYETGDHSNERLRWVGVLDSLFSEENHLKLLFAGEVFFIVMNG